jgi:hypothetical protein
MLIFIIAYLTGINFQSADMELQYVQSSKSIKQNSTKMEGPSLYRRLKNGLVKCPLSNQYFLPLAVLDAEINVANVQAELPFQTRVTSPKLPRTVVREARRIFAILVLIGEVHAIKPLLKAGLTDKCLPVSSRQGGDRVLLFSDGRTFCASAIWKEDARVDDFLRTQWEVLAPVFTFTGKHMTIDSLCALPFGSTEVIGASRFSTIYKSSFHPSHQMKLNVSM